MLCYCHGMETTNTTGRGMCRQDYYFDHFGRASRTDEQDVVDLLTVISSSTWFDDASTATKEDLVAILHDFE